MSRVSTRATRAEPEHYMLSGLRRPGSIVRQVDVLDLGSTRVMGTTIHDPIRCRAYAQIEGHRDLEARVIIVSRGGKRVVGEVPVVAPDAARLPPDGIPATSLRAV